MLIKTKLPLSLQVVIGVSVGTFLGVLFGSEPYLWGFLKNETLEQLGMLVIRWRIQVASAIPYFT
jgi:hypothetical protein